MITRSNRIKYNKVIKESFLTGSKSRFNRNQKKYKSAKAFVPKMDLQEVFRHVMKRFSVKPEHVDELRKIYYLHFKFYKDVISDGNFIAIEIPKIGRIIPNEKKLFTFCSNISKGSSFINYNENDIKNAFYEAVEAILKIQHLRNNKTKKTEIKDDRFTKNLQEHYKQWSADFKKRGINIKRFEYWERDSNCEGLFV